MGAKRVSKQGVTVSTGNAIEVTNTTGSVLFSVDSTGSLNTLPNLTAKGSILTASAANTPATLAVGANGYTLVADSSTSTGLAYSPTFFAGKNKIINGDFGINQRAFSSASGSGVAQYTFDRWFATNSGGTYNPSAQTFTPGTAPVVGYESTNFLRNATSGQSASGDYSVLLQRIEDVRTLANQTATISFWAKASSGTPKIGVEISQNFGSGGSPSADVNTAVGAITISTSWARYSATIAVPSISGKTIGTTANTSHLQINFWLSAGSTLATRASSIGIQNSTIDVWGIQVEAGSTATQFQTATGTIQGELAACQRYYWRANAAAASNVLSTMGTAYNTSGVIMSWQNPVPMRVKASSIDYSALEVIDFVNAGQAITSATADANSTPSNSVSVIGVAGTPLTQYRNYAVRGTSASGYVGFSAEL